MKPNILLITVDQMRADCLSSAGHPVVRTPNLDGLAESGVMFRNAYSATPTCVPARAAIMTGMSQRSHGRVGYEDRVPWQYEHMLAGELANAGYHTQCVGKMHVYPTRNLCGFHNVVLHDGYMHYNRDRKVQSAAGHFDECDDYLHWLRDQAGSHHDIMDMALDCNASTVTLPWHLPERLHPTNWAVTQSIDFLRRRDPSKPFFLWTSFVRPHPPFDPPQAYLDMYIHQTLPDPPVGDWVNEFAAEAGSASPITGLKKLRADELQRARAGYYALITHLDYQIGRLINALNEYGELNNTVIVFTSDHGEMMGDHHYYRKALAYEGSAKVPFIISDRTGKLGFKAGSTVSEVIEMRDIMPTLLDAAGAAIPDCVDGQSVIPLCNVSEERSWRTYLHGEHAYGALSHHYITDGHWKYIWYSQTGTEQLFHLDEDPQELRNLAADDAHEAELALGRSRLIHELRDREEGYVANGALMVGRTPKSCLTHLREQQAVHA